MAKQKTKKFITPADVQRMVNQFCELNKINLKDNPQAMDIAYNIFFWGVWCGRNGNKTFQDYKED